MKRIGHSGTEPSIDGAVETPLEMGIGELCPHISALMGSWKDDRFERRPDNDSRDMLLLGVATPRPFTEGDLPVITFGGATNGHFSRPGVPGVVKSCSISESADLPFQIRTPGSPVLLIELYRYLSLSRASSAR